LHDGAVNVVSQGHWSGLFPLVALADLRGVGGPVAGGGSLPGDCDGDVDAEVAGRSVCLPSGSREQLLEYARSLPQHARTQLSRCRRAMSSIRRALAPC
jgi:hypothetical protein